MNQGKMAFVIGVACLIGISFIGETVLPFMAIGWFNVIQSSIDPAEKADYFSALFDSAVLRAYAYGISLVVMGIVFSCVHGLKAHVPANLIFSLLGAMYVALVPGFSVSGFSIPVFSVPVFSVHGLAVGAVFGGLCFLSVFAVDALRARPRQNGVQAEAGVSESFEEKVQRIRDKQRLSRRASSAGKPSASLSDHPE